MSPPYQPVGNAPKPQGTSGTGSTSSTGTGLAAGYQVPTMPDVVPPYEGLHPGPGLPGTVYGTAINPNPYDVANDSYMLPYNDQESIPQLQAALIQAGLLSRSQVRPGQWDATSAAAYARVLLFANHFGLTANQALNVYLNNPKLAGTSSTGGSGTAAATVFTNPQDVATEFQNVSQNLTGQEQPTGAFQSAYQGQEAAAQHQKGTDYTRAPSLTGAATQYVLNNDPSQVQAYGAASRMLELQNMLGVK